MTAGGTKKSARADGSSGVSRWIDVATIKRFGPANEERMLEGKSFESGRRQRVR